MTMHVQLDHTVVGDRRARPLPALWSTLIDDVLSVEMSFLLFLTSGRYKVLPELQFIPVDPTILFLVLTLGLIIHKCGSRLMRPLPLDAADLLMMSFVALAMLSVFWSSLDPKNVDKAWRFVLVGISGYFFASVLAQEKERRDRLVRLMVGFSVALMAYYSFHRWIIGVSTWELENTGRIRGNNYLEYGAHVAWLFCSSLAIVVFGPRRWLVPGLAGAVVSLFLLLAVGARGALIFSVLTIPMAAGALLVRRGGGSVGFRRLFLLLVVLAAMAWAGYAALVAVKGFSGASEQLYTLERLTLQLSNEATFSLDVRAEGRELALRRWLELPLFGWGFGEFRVQHSLDYPHNLLLETLMEMGLAGVVLFIPAQVIALFACWRAIRDPESGWIEMTIALKYVAEFISHMTVEGYLGDNRTYFALIAMAVCLGRKPLRTLARRRVAA